MELAPRHERRKDEIKEELRVRYTKQLPQFYAGVIEGLRLGIKKLYPDIEHWFKEDESATELTLTGIALQELSSEQENKGHPDGLRSDGGDVRKRKPKRVADVQGSDS